MGGAVAAAGGCQRRGPTAATAAAGPTAGASGGNRGSGPSGGPVEGAICMLVPEEQKDTFYLDIIGRISELLVEEPGFLTALKRGDKTGSVDMAEKVLLKYFNQLIN